VLIRISKLEDFRLAAGIKMALSISGHIETRMRILLIGGNGFIGSPLTRALIAHGHSLAMLHRSAKGNLDEEVVAIQGDRNHLLDSIGQIQRFSPQVIVDLILTSGEQAAKLMSVVRTVAQRVVAISSMDVYRAWGVMRQSEPGALEPLPLSENSPLRTNRQLYSPETLKMMQTIFSWFGEH
jgi:nucleoside-diphosphate-sugar epimerase